MVAKALNLLSLLAEELDVSCVLVLGLSRGVGGTVLLDPALVGIVPLVVASATGELEILLECLFAVYKRWGEVLAMACYENSKIGGKNHSLLIALGSVRNMATTPLSRRGQPTETLAGMLLGGSERSDTIAEMHSFLSWTRLNTSMLPNHMVKNRFVQPMASSSANASTGL